MKWFEEMESRIPRKGLRTRFAPSPTGYMHIGNLRTALFAWLIARRAGGTFLLRIEDTDQERLVPNAVDAIYRTLRACGLSHDEGPDVGGPVGPYVQSERRGIYKKYAELLIEKGGAYRCFCGEARLNELRGSGKDVAKYDRHCLRLSPDEIAEKLRNQTPYVIRQLIPEGTAAFSDVIFGEISVEGAELEDQVLIKSDGMPTYNFANVIDDHLMGVTHVVRGTEYLSSAPKYNLLYAAFGWELPVYVHCAPVMRDANTKMSKRHGDPSFEDLIAEGYLPEAVVNYVALLGWSPGGEREIFSLHELAEIFEISGLSKSPAIFDPVKLVHFNSEWIRAMPPEAFHALAEPYIRQGVKRDGTDTRLIASLLQSRCEKLTDIPEKIDFLDALPAYSTELYVHQKMKTTLENSLEALLAASPVLSSLTDWNQSAVSDALTGLAGSMGVKSGRILWPVRVALSGKQSTPGGATELCVLLGREESLRRIQDGIARLS